jgi:uncharacterized protein YndB with AHSA1/START domain
MKASRSRVWRVIADAEAFGDWFGVALKGHRFVAGESAHGHITHPSYEHLLFEIALERIEPQLLLSFHWHPCALDATHDLSNEPSTRVVFELEEVEGGTLLRVIESGFDRIPAERRAEASRMNSGCWDQQMENIQNHVAIHRTSHTEPPCDGSVAAQVRTGIRSAWGYHPAAPDGCAVRWRRHVDRTAHRRHCHQPASGHAAPGRAGERRPGSRPEAGSRTFVAVHPGPTR